MGSILKLHHPARHPTMAGARLVADVIDFEQRDEGMMVAHGICDQLDDMKHEYAGLPDFLTRVRLLLLGPVPERRLLWVSWKLVCMTKQLM